MKKYLLTIVAIALLWISSSKEKEKDPIKPDTTTSRSLLRESYMAYDTVRWEYNLDSTPLKYTCKSFYGPSDFWEYYTMNYDSSKSNKVNIWKKKATDEDSVPFYKMKYTNNKRRTFNIFYPWLVYRDSFAFKPNGQIEKVYAIDKNSIYMIDSLKWTNSNITKIYHNVIGDPSLPSIPATIIYTYDDKPNPLRELMKVAQHAPVNSTLPRYYSVNNITGSTWYQPGDGYLEKM